MIAALKLDDFHHSRNFQPYGSRIIATIVAAIIPNSGAAMIAAKITQSRSSGFITPPVAGSFAVDIAATVFQLAVNDKQTIQDFLCFLSTK